MITFTYGIIATIISAVLIAVGLYGNSTGETKPKRTKALRISAIGLVLILVAGYSLIVPGSMPWLDTEIEGTAGETLTVSPTTVTSAGTCAIEGYTLVNGVCGCFSTDGDTTVTLSAIDKEDTSATGGTHRYKVNGGAAKTVSDGGTFTASPGDELEVLFENASLTGSYYSEVLSTIIPCVGTEQFTAELSQNGTMSIKVFNSDGNSIDGSATNETIGAGDSKSLSIQMNAQNKRAFPYGGVLVVEYNDTEFDEITLSSSDVSLSKASGVPAVHSLTSTDNRAIAYDIGAMDGSAIRLLTLNYDADDTYNPADDTGDIVITYRPNNYFIDEDNRGAFAGPSAEDEDDAATYGHVTTFTLGLS